MSYTNFQVGEKFPLPIQAAGDGGLFQIDANGMMFILQLSNTDVIATEAFRTGKMELALYEEDGLLFFLYQIDGIFKTGWGDAPLALHRLPPELQPDFAEALTPTDPEVEELVKAADKLSAHIKCLEELKAGNLEFRRAAEQTEQALDDFHLPELTYFREHFLPSFRLTLDEME